LGIIGGIMAKANMEQIDLFVEQPKIKLPPQIVALDVEGTGGKEPDLIELAVVTIKSGMELTDSTSWLMKPEKKITYFAHKIHGISNNDVINLQPFNYFEDDIRKALGCHAIVAHNASIDYRMLKRKMPDWEPNYVFDTLRLSRKIINSMESYSLEFLIQQLDLDDIIKNEVSVGIHRSLYDAFAAAYLFLHLYKLAKEKKMNETTFYNLAQIIH
jgi:exodeoxyribonuclease X